MNLTKKEKVASIAIIRILGLLLQVIKIRHGMTGHTEKQIRQARCVCNIIVAHMKCYDESGLSSWHFSREVAQSLPTFLSFLADAVSLAKSSNTVIPAAAVAFSLLMNSPTSFERLQALHPKNLFSLIWFRPHESPTPTARLCSVRCWTLDLSDMLSDGLAQNSEH